MINLEVLLEQTEVFKKYIAHNRYFSPNTAEKMKHIIEGDSSLNSFIEYFKSLEKQEWDVIELLKHSIKDKQVCIEYILRFYPFTDEQMGDFRKIVGDWLDLTAKVKGYAKICPERRDEIIEDFCKYKTV